MAYGAFDETVCTAPLGPKTVPRKVHGMVKMKRVTGVLYNVCVFIHEDERVISHETMKLVKMIEMLIMRLRNP